MELELYSCYDKSITKKIKNYKSFYLLLGNRIIRIKYGIFMYNRRRRQTLRRYKGKFRKYTYSWYQSLDAYW
jgi:hypothetical protein